MVCHIFQTLSKSWQGSPQTHATEEMVHDIKFLDNPEVLYGMQIQLGVSLSLALGIVLLHEESTRMIGKEIVNKNKQEKPSPMQQMSFIASMNSNTVVSQLR